MMALTVKVAKFLGSENGQSVAGIFVGTEKDDKPEARKVEIVGPTVDHLRAP
jgi:hypothetical protein